MYVALDAEYGVIGPFSVAAPLWGQTPYNLSGLSLKMGPRSCKGSSKVLVNGVVTSVYYPLACTRYLRCLPY